MVATAERDSELIADLATEGAALRKPEMVRVRGSSAADEGRVGGGKFDVIPIAKASRFQTIICRI